MSVLFTVELNQPIFLYTHLLLSLGLFNYLRTRMCNKHLFTAAHVKKRINYSQPADNLYQLNIWLVLGI